MIGVGLLTACGRKFFYGLLPGQISLKSGGIMAHVILYARKSRVMSKQEYTCFRIN